MLLPVCAFAACSPKHTRGNQLAAKVLERVFHKAPVFYRDGGTIPALAYFQSILGVDTTGFGFGLGDHIHAPNERTPVGQYHIGRSAYVEMLAELGQSWPADAIRAAGGSKKEQKGKRQKKKTTNKSSSSSSSSSYSSSSTDEHGYDRAEL